MKNRGSLLKTLKRLEHSVNACAVLIKNESVWVLNSDKTHELAQTPRQIDRIQLEMTELSRQLASLSRQIRSLLGDQAHCIAMPTPAKRASLLSQSHRHPGQCSAFAAVNDESGAIVVRVRKDTSAVWPQKEYGHFETWTQAQSFAATLNQRYGIDVLEAQHIVVSAKLAAAASRAQKS